MITLTHCFSNSGSENQVFDVSNFADLSGIVETVTANVLCAKEPTLFPTAMPIEPQPTKSPSPPTPPPTPQPTTLSPTKSPTVSPSESPTRGVTGAPTTSCDAGTPLVLYDFDSSSLDLNSGPFSLDSIEGPDPPVQPWERDTNRGCNGSAAGVTAGRQTGGVDEDSILIIDIPPGATSVSYFYSYPSALDTTDQFHVMLDSTGNIVQQYQSGPGETCVEACLDISGSTTLQFRCTARGRNERCTIDEVQFYSAPGARKLIDSDIVSRPPPDITEMTSTPIKKPTVEPAMTPSAESENESPIKKHTATTTSSAGSDFPFSASSPGQSCNKETAGKDEICSAEDSPHHFNCCMDAGKQ